MVGVNFLEKARAFLQMEVRIFGLDTNKKMVRGSVRETRNVENRMMGMGQSVQREHTEHRGERCPQNRQLKGDGNKGGPAIEGAAANV